jgi:hypothetical protein
MSKWSPAYTGEHLLTQAHSNCWMRNFHSKALGGFRKTMAENTKTNGTTTDTSASTPTNDGAVSQAKKESEATRLSKYGAYELAIEMVMRERALRAVTSDGKTEKVVKVSDIEVAFAKATENMSLAEKLEYIRSKAVAQHARAESDGPNGYSAVLNLAYGYACAAVKLPRKDVRAAIKEAVESDIQAGKKVESQVLIGERKRKESGLPTSWDGLDYTRK